MTDAVVAHLVAARDQARATRPYPSDLQAAPAAVGRTLLASLCWLRAWEITDALVDLLIGLVHTINARADRRLRNTVDLLSASGRVDQSAVVVMALSTGRILADMHGHAECRTSEATA